MAGALMTVFHRDLLLINGETREELRKRLRKRKRKPASPRSKTSAAAPREQRPKTSSQTEPRGTSTR
jgi:hypothetical protein